LKRCGEVLEGVGPFGKNCGKEICRAKEDNEGDVGGFGRY